MSFLYCFWCEFYFDILNNNNKRSYEKVVADVYGVVGLHRPGYVEGLAAIAHQASEERKAIE